MFIDSLVPGWEEGPGPTKKRSLDIPQGGDGQGPTIPYDTSVLLCTHIYYIYYILRHDRLSLIYSFKISSYPVRVSVFMPLDTVILTCFEKMWNAAAGAVVKFKSKTH